MGSDSIDFYRRSTLEFYTITTGKVTTVMGGYFESESVAKFTAIHNHKRRFVIGYFRYACLILRRLMKALQQRCRNQMPAIDKHKQNDFQRQRNHHGW